MKFQIGYTSKGAKILPSPGTKEQLEEIQRRHSTRQPTNKDASTDNKPTAERVEDEAWFVQLFGPPSTRNSKSKIPPRTIRKSNSDVDNDDALDIPDYFLLDDDSVWTTMSSITMDEEICSCAGTDGDHIMDDNLDGTKLSLDISMVEEETPLWPTTYRQPPSFSLRSRRRSVADPTKPSVVSHGDENNNRKKNAIQWFEFSHSTKKGDHQCWCWVGLCSWNQQEKRPSWPGILLYGVVCDTEGDNSDTEIRLQPQMAPRQRQLDWYYQSGTGGNNCSCLPSASSCRRTTTTDKSNTKTKQTSDADSSFKTMSTTELSGSRSSSLLPRSSSVMVLPECMDRV